MRKYVCACGKSYCNTSSLYNHKKFSCGGKLPQYVCSFCDHRSKRSYDVKKHVIRKHVSEFCSTKNEMPQHLYCNFCSYNTLIRKNMEIHVGKAHRRFVIAATSSSRLPLFSSWTVSILATILGTLYKTIILPP